MSAKYIGPESNPPSQASLPLQQPGPSIDTAGAAGASGGDDDDDDDDDVLADADAIGVGVTMEVPVGES